MHEPWTVESSQIVFENRWWKIRKDLVRLPDGSAHEHFVNEGSDGAVIVPVAEDGRVYLQRIYKHGAGRAVLEFPMGRVDPGETPDLAAARELLEETGLAAELEPLGSFWTFPTSSNAKMHAYLGRHARQVAEPEDNPREQAEAAWVSTDELREMLKRGELASLLQTGTGYRALEVLGKI